MWAYALVAFGGAVGCMARLGLARSFHLQWGTLAANVVACLVLGYLSARLKALEPDVHENWRLLVGTGFCGGLSTFSTLMLELVGYTQKGDYADGLGYLALSVALGTVSLVLGMWAAGRVA